jgi:hypothetical protein
LNLRVFIERAGFAIRNFSIIGGLNSVDIFRGQLDREATMAQVDSLVKLHGRLVKV